MICSEAHDAILVADADQLVAGAGDLASHLAECDACRAKAAIIAAATAALESQVRRRSRARRSRRLVAAAMVPLAAGLAAVAVLRIRATDAPAVPAATRVSALPVARNVSVTVERGQTATLIKTADPSVTVIWLSPGAGQ